MPCPPTISLCDFSGAALPGVSPFLSSGLEVDYKDCPCVFVGELQKSELAFGAFAAMADKYYIKDNIKKPAAHHESFRALWETKWRTPVSLACESNLQCDKLTENAVLDGRL